MVSGVYEFEKNRYAAALLQFCQPRVPQNSLQDILFTAEIPKKVDSSLSDQMYAAFLRKKFRPVLRNKVRDTHQSRLCRCQKRSHNQKGPTLSKRKLLKKSMSEAARASIPQIIQMSPNGAITIARRKIFPSDLMENSWPFIQCRVPQIPGQQILLRRSFLLRTEGVLKMLTCGLPSKSHHIRRTRRGRQSQCSSKHCITYGSDRTAFGCHKQRLYFEAKRHVYKNFFESIRCARASKKFSAQVWEGFAAAGQSDSSVSCGQKTWTWIISMAP
ncbi:hypothetical protein BCR43DRAFT_108304 [Syncephalastrum racemosum]|uniref:Uncharacterized protein n=1 Tax=Syncephalastrum racemosum TaxID=13706 RepID=A0A1X2H1Y2_SYNRA|nr:hypothetical protein BCR43DRAFT_108304 [Syncephalastrum racemosum]